MGFQADGVAVAGLLEGAELSCPIRVALAYGGPCEAALGAGFGYGAFDVAVSNAVFGDEVKAGWEGVEFAAGYGVAWVPVELEVRGLDGGEGLGGFAAGCGVAFIFVFEDEQEVVFACARGCFEELGVDGFAIGLRVIETPEVEAANAVGLELLGEFDAAFEDFVLLFEIEAGAEVIVFGTVLRAGRPGEIDFEERAGDVGDAELVFVENGICVGDVGIVELEDVLAPHTAQLDPLQAEVVGDDRAGVIEVVGYLVVDDGDAEGGLQFGCSERCGKVGGDGCGGCAFDHGAAREVGHHCS